MSKTAVDSPAPMDPRALRAVVCIADLRRTMGGSSRSVPQLCEALVRADIDTCLVGAVDSPDDLVLPRGQVRFTDVGGRRRRHDILRAVGSALVTSSSRRVVVHDNGIWRPFHHHVASAAKRAHVPLVLSPRGTLTPWAVRYKYAKKQLAWLLYQRRDLGLLTAFHATSELEASELRDLGFRQPIAVVANGIDFPRELPVPKPQHSVRKMLFLSRIHEKKGLLNLLHAFKAARPGPEWRLSIAGPDEGGHRCEVEALARALGLQTQVEFPGEIADADKWALYAEAEVFVLPSFSENFGLVVAEALACGTAAITTTGTPWSELPKNNLGWWREPTVESLSAAIREATSMPPEALREMGVRAAPWARARFSWDTVASEMKTLYNWLADGGTPPRSVQQVSPHGPSPRYRLR
jgi:glycosyltransferase involved in cell wall biosynthesis